MSSRWVDFNRAWHDTEVVNCPVCGRLIPSRAWVFEVPSGEITACSEECEELYFSYVEPTHGPIRGMER
ncbi:MAG: hypothetical protein U0R24_04950 [Solirubrobacterales bacterium]